MNTSTRYAVWETLPPGLEQVSATCSDGSDPSSDINLSVGEIVTCAFVNEVPEVVSPVETLPFTGLFTDELMRLGLRLTLAGVLAVTFARRHELEGLSGEEHQGRRGS